VGQSYDGATGSINVNMLHHPCDMQLGGHVVVNLLRAAKYTAKGVATVLDMIDIRDALVKHPGVILKNFELWKSLSSMTIAKFLAMVTLEEGNEATEAYRAQIPVTPDPFLPDSFDSPMFESACSEAGLICRKNAGRLPPLILAGVIEVGALVGEVTLDVGFSVAASYSIDYGAHKLGEVTVTTFSLL
jgi:hypothetical protein